MLRWAEVGVGDVVGMRFRVADQGALAVPDELAAALSQQPDARAEWKGLTPGKRRALAHRVDGARTATTRARRIAEVIEALSG